MSLTKNNRNIIEFFDMNIASVVAISVILICVFVACEKPADKGSGTTARQVTETLLFEIPWGREKGLVGFLPRTESYEDQGPTSFYVGQHGRIIYVLDTTNRRINIYESGKFVKEIKLRSGYYPRDIMVHSEAIYFLSNMTIEKLSHDGSVIKSEVIVGPGHPLRRTEKVFADGNTIVVLSWGDTRAGDFACFDDVSLEAKSCESIREIYAHKVIDADSNKKFIAYKDDDLIYVRGMAVESIGPIPYVEELYPPIRLFRVSNGKIYIMRPTDKGISFYLQE